MKAELWSHEADRPAHLTIERMTIADVRAVTRIEALSFSTSWPASAFASELNDNKLAYYFVGHVGEREIVAYGGIWVILEDAHVTTIAVLPDWRGRRYGEELLVKLIREAMDRGASYISLEARESNTVAQNLYRKYGFSIISTRRGYYSDNGENAVVMWAGNLKSDLYRNRLAVLEAELARSIDRRL